MERRTRTQIDACTKMKRLLKVDIQYVSIDTRFVGIVIVSLCQGEDGAVVSSQQTLAQPRRRVTHCSPDAPGTLRDIEKTC